MSHRQQKGSGGKNPRRYKKQPASATQSIDLDSIMKTKGQEYGRVVRELGNRRIEVLCQDKVVRLCHIPGSMLRRVWVGVNSVVLINLRDYQPSKADVIYKYSPAEIKLLRERNSLTPDLVHDEKEGDDVSFEEPEAEIEVPPQKEYPSPESSDSDD